MLHLRMTGSTVGIFTPVSLWTCRQCMVLRCYHGRCYRCWCGCDASSAIILWTRHCKCVPLQPETSLGGTWLHSPPSYEVRVLILPFCTQKPKHRGTPQTRSSRAKISNWVFFIFFYWCYIVSMRGRQGHAWAVWRGGNKMTVSRVLIRKWNSWAEWDMSVEAEDGKVKR